MDLQEAIIQVVEEWREKRGMTKILGMAIFPASPRTPCCWRQWNHIKEAEIPQIKNGNLL